MLITNTLKKIVIIWGVGKIVPKRKKCVETTHFEN
jgi:hypothetical protein